MNESSAKGVQPSRLYPDYKSTILRAPSHPLVVIPQAMKSFTGPLFRDFNLGPLDHDLTRNSAINGAPQGERIIVHGNK